MSTKIAPSASFYRSIYSEVEEVGWEYLVNLEEDLSSLQLRALDSKRRSHIINVLLPQGYPNIAPLLSADVPYICPLQWSRRSRLKDLVHQFVKHLENFQEFWSTMSEIDKSLVVIDPIQPSYSSSYRLISIGNDSFLQIFVNLEKPRSLPECRFFGPDSFVNRIRAKWRSNGNRWMLEKPFVENLASILDVKLPTPLNIGKDEQDIDCGICYAQYLPVDDELGVMSGIAPDYTCDFPNCKKDFHSVCLRDWLRSISTTRQSFDVLFGNCPYCNEPVAVNMNGLS